MDKRLVVTMSGVAALAIIALIEKSVVMFVSAGAIGIIAYVFQRARVRDRVIAIFVAGLAGGIGAEIALTLFRHSITAVAGDNGELFMSSMLLGLMNATAIVVLISLTEIYLKYVSRKSRM